VTMLQSNSGGVPEGHVEGYPIERRMVKFDWSETPAHWVPGDPLTSHVINVLHLLLPAGESWFIDVVNRVRPGITDPQLQDAIKPFIQQESWHAQAHQRVLEALDRQGIDSEPYTRRLDKMFNDALSADHPSWPRPLRKWMERRNLAAVAAIEHFTAVLGHWILENRRLEEMGADPQMLDLLRWHGAEEVEHRALVFDVHRAVGGRWFQRATAMLSVAPTLTYCWVSGVRYLARHDPHWSGPLPSWHQFFQATRDSRLPTLRSIFDRVPAYMSPGYHPSREFSTEQALDYIARSPAARAAASRRAG
jgi:predicted metal-dependent hydrolase